MNPYYSAMPAAVVASSPYDYAPPVVFNNYVTNDGDLTDASTVEGGSAVSESAPEAAATLNAVLAVAPKPMQAPAEASAGAETDLVGTWMAASGPDSVQLAVTADSQFTWKAVPSRGAPVEIAGTTVCMPLTNAGEQVCNGVPLGPEALLAVPRRSDFHIHVRRRAHDWCSVALPFDVPHAGSWIARSAWIVAISSGVPCP